MGSLSDQQDYLKFKRKEKRQDKDIIKAFQAKTNYLLRKENQIIMGILINSSGYSHVRYTWERRGMGYIMFLKMSIEFCQ